MANSLRPLLSLGAGFLGFTVGGPLGFAVATVLFNVVMPPRPLADGGLERSKQEERNTSINTALWQVFGRAERSGGDCIRCRKDADGVRSGIRIRIKKTSVGGGSGGIGAPEQTVEEEKQFLYASFALCEGFTTVEQLLEVNSKSGEKIIFDIDDLGKSEINPTPLIGPVSGKVIGYLSEEVRIYFGSEEQPIDSAEYERFWE